MTKSVAFLVQNNHVLYNSIPVAQYALRNGIDLYDRSSHADFDPFNCGVDWSEYDIIVPYGSVQFARKCRESGLSEHVFYSEPNFHTDLWIQKFGEKALNYTGTLMKAGDVREHLTYAKEAHVRPNHQDKTFVAAVFTIQSWDEQRSIRDFDDDLDVFVSPPMIIDAEFRCWVIGGKIVEVSEYQRDGAMWVERVDINNPMVQNAQQLADVFLPNEACVMDIAMVGDQMYFLEFNSIHSSGFYKADINFIWHEFVRWRVQ